MSEHCRLHRFVLAVLSTLLALPALAQGTGSVAGAVIDASGQVIPGATVTLTDERTRFARSLTSDAKGDFLFVAMPPATYTLKIELTGFRTLERRGNVLTASGAVNLGVLKLEVGTLTEVVTVEVQGTKVETSQSDHTALLTANQLQQIQSKGRDVTNLLRLLPGVRYGDDIDAIGESFGSVIPNIGGNRQHWSVVMVDGVYGNEVSGQNRMASQINLDAIAEIKVELDSFKAEFGRGGGANIQVVSKGGGSEYSGSAYYFGRRDSLNANTWQNNRTNVARGKYVFDTYGFNFGGPVKIPGLYDQKDEKKLFFFYSLEAPRVNTPAGLRQYRMPTERERAGDFSQTFDTTGRLIFIKDPQSSGACSVTAGGPGCFPGNVIPANRLDPNARALLALLPLPNRLDSPTPALWNFVRQETPEKPRLNNLLRFDYRPSAKNSWYLALRTFNSTQTGSEITAGPAKWGFFDAQYIFSDSGASIGNTHIFHSHLINEASFGFKRATEGFPAATDADYARIQKRNIGYNLGQFNSGLNPDGIIPNITFGLASTGIDTPDFTFDSRLGQTAWDWVYSLRENISWVKGNHNFKGGFYGEFMKNHEARGGQWNGQFQFNNNTSNPLNTNFAFANAELGVFSQYTETDHFRETLNRGWQAEAYVQDSWRPSRRLTFDYGLRLLWYTPFYRPDNQVANFDPAKYDLAKAPRLYRPATVNGQRVAFDPVTGQALNPIYIGAYVPGTGDELNGMIKSGDPGVPLGFRENQGIQPEPRVGFAWDVFGTGKSALRGSAGLFHNPRLGGGSLGNLAANPPFIHNPIVYYGTMSTLFQPGVTLANRPVQMEALEVNAQTPSIYKWSLGVQQEIGWGTVLDVAYVGSVGRHLEMYTDINAVPDGARFQEANRDPTNSGALPGAALPAEFLRPYRGYQSIRYRSDWGTSNYNALQLQINRRYIRGLQVGFSYTYAKSLALADEDPGNLSAATNRDPQTWLYAPIPASPMHTLVVNYTWDVPKLSKVWNNVFVRGVFDGWQISGENVFVTGDWAPVVLTTVDNFDFTGGDGGNGGDLGGGFRTVRPRMVGDPKLANADPLTGWFNTSAFARPTGRGDYGDTPRNVIQRPGINNWNLSAFKNFGLGGHGKRKLQLRLEGYNVLNHTQFSDVNRTARFDAAGAQTDATFGTANTARLPRIIQVSARLYF